MKQDEFGTVLNAPETYKAIVSDLRRYGSVLIAWTDEEGTQFDILFIHGVVMYGPVQGGIGGDDLFVSIMRKGCFGFEIANTDTHPGYYAEKLQLSEKSSTTKKLAELINGIKIELKGGEE